MTIKFFPLFFKNEVGFSPVQVQVTFLISSFGMAVFAREAQWTSTKVRAGQMMPTETASRRPKRPAALHCWGAQWTYVHQGACRTKSCRWNPPLMKTAELDWTDGWARTSN